ncbi:MAG TPA: ATPase, partial [Actinomycetota bacterium]|nr:ATPase [Actinomycetota bacterium]
MTKKSSPPVVAGMDRPSRPRPSQRETRAPSAMWDRVKFLLLLGLLWLSGLAVVWAASVNPLGGPFSDAIRIALVDYAWILVLAGVELLRQLHYFVEEHSKGYYRFWEKKVFGRTKGLGRGLDDWTRFRLARAIKLFIFLLALSTF